MTMKGTPAAKPQKITPAPADITYDRVRDLVLKYAEQHDGKYWLSTNLVIALMNGWNGDSVYQNASYTRARKKLQQLPGYTTHEMPTSSQASAMRKQLEKLAEEKLVEKARGHTDGNNSWGYRWITDAMKAERELRRDVGAQAKDVARRLSLALGGDGESGVTPFITPDNGIGIRVNLYGTTAERLLHAIEVSCLEPAFFRVKP
jgi:hypothetical protein